MLQIHDELLFEAPEDEVERAVGDRPRARWRARSSMDPPLEVDVGVGANWLEAK